MLGKLLGAVGKILILAGILILGFVAFQLWGTGLESGRGQSQMTEQLAAELAPASPTDDKTLDLEELTEKLAETDPATAPPMAPPPEGSPIGVISIPTINLDRVVVEGVSKADLKKGPGHYPSTPLPGQSGNSAIAGHRTTYGAPFNRIDELIPGDEIKVTTVQGEFVYVVIPAPGQPADGQAWFAVSPRQVEVLANMGDNRLTLTACHPKYSARQRIVVHAVLRGPSATPAVATTPTRTESTADEPASIDEGLQGDPDALRSVFVFGGAAALVAAAAWLLSRYMRSWIVWLIAFPAILALVWFGYVYMDRYLPAL